MNLHLAAIKKFIENNRMTKTEFSDAIGYDRSYVSRVLNGRDPLNTKFIISVRNAFPGINFSIDDKNIPNDIEESIDVKIFEYDTIIDESNDVVDFNSIYFHESREFSLNSELSSIGGNFIAFRMNDSSMKNTINRNDILICKQISNNDIRRVKFCGVYVILIKKIKNPVIRRFIPRELNGVVHHLQSYCDNRGYADDDILIRAVDILLIFDIKIVIRKNIDSNDVFNSINSLNEEYNRLLSKVK